MGFSPVISSLISQINLKWYSTLFSFFNLHNQKRFMEFGRLSEEELNTIDFSLPAEPAANKNILSGKPAAAPKVYV